MFCSTHRNSDQILRVALPVDLLNHLHINRRAAYLYGGVGVCHMIAKKVSMTSAMAITLTFDTQLADWIGVLILGDKRIFHFVLASKYTVAFLKTSSIPAVVNISEDSRESFLRALSNVMPGP